MSVSAFDGQYPHTNRSGEQAIAAMPYLKEIRKGYKQVQQNSVNSQKVVKMALQYENWKNLPGSITNKICDHNDYPDLDADSDKPVPATSQLGRECQMQRNTQRIDLAYTLHRYRPTASSLPFDPLDAGDFPRIWELLAKDKNRSKQESKRWVTTVPLTLRSEQDFRDLICRLGMYHWQGTPQDTPVFCLKLSGINCVKPNALDADLAFYFHQTPEKAPGRTRNLKTGRPDMEEWLCPEKNQASIKCVGVCFIRKDIKINMGAYFGNCVKRIQGNKG